MRKIKLRIAEILTTGTRQKQFDRYFGVFIEILVLLNVAAVILESFDEIEKRFTIEFEVFEIFTVFVFSAEFLLRLWVSDVKYPAKYRFQAYKKYLLSPLAIIDLLAILPFFLPFIFNIDLRHVRVIRLLRLMRVFRLDKYSNSLLLIYKIMQEKKEELLAAFILTFSVLVVASSLMFYVERDLQPDKFPTILHAFWWGIATLTTVGYGDIYPITGLGKVLGAIVALMGVMIVAIPTGIVSSSFVQKMEETNYKKRINEIRKKLKEAFYKKYVPEIACKVRRGQVSVDSIKMNLEFAEADIYKIAEGRNEFRFRYKKMIVNGRLEDKLFLEYRDINTSYGTFSNRHSRLTLVSTESLNAQGIGYFVYCLSEKIRCNYISNEFFGDEGNSTEESFGDKGLEPESTFNFRHNKVYIQKNEENVPTSFHHWLDDLKKNAIKNSIFIVFNSSEQESNGHNFVHLTTFKRKNLVAHKDEYTFEDQTKISEFKEALQQKAELKFDLPLKVSLNGNFQTIRENNILLYINEKLNADCLVITVYKEFLIGEKLFQLAAIMADAIKEELLGIE